MKKQLIHLLAAMIAGAGLVAMSPAPQASATPSASATAAAAPAGCVTLAEARRTFKNRTQTRGQIDRGLGTRGVRADRMGNTEWRAYRPCRYPSSTYVHVIYVKQAGAWRTIYWNYSLARGGIADRHTDSWGARG